MTKDELKTMLESRDVTFRRVAIDEVVMSFPVHSDLFFSAFHTSDESAMEMANAARQWMPVLRDGYDDAMTKFESPERYAVFSNLAESYSVFIKEMYKYIASLDENTAQHTKDLLWHNLPGLRTELEGVANQQKPDKRRQLMVFVTGKCNMHCPYCFSMELQRSSISKTDMMRILSWAQRNKVQSLLPCGGEPLMYENIDWLIQETERLGIKMYFATNLSVRMPDVLLNGKSNSVEQLHVHITNELFDNERLMSKFRNNLRLCRENGTDIILRGNIFADDSENHYDEWFKIAKDADINALNVAFTIPSHKGINSFVHFDLIRAMIPRLRRILEQGRENNIRVSIAKPLPLCLFPEDMALDILRHNHNASFCNVNEDDGMHNLSLSTDLRFSPCLGVDEPSVPFSDELGWDTLRDIFSKTIGTLQSQTFLEHCDSCFLYHRRLCQGACLSYKQPRRNGGVPCGN